MREPLADVKLPEDSECIPRMPRAMSALSQTQDSGLSWVDMEPAVIWSQEAFFHVNLDASGGQR